MLLALALASVAAVWCGTASAAAGKPTISGLTAVNVTKTGATVEGQFDPGELETHVYFTYHAHNGPVTTTERVAIGGGSSAVHEAQALTGLTPGTEYTVTATAENADGSVQATTMFFTLGPPAFSEFFLSSLGETGAELTLQVDPDGFATEVSLECRKGKEPGFVCATPVQIGAATSLQEATLHAEHLSLASEYTVTAVAVNQEGRSTANTTIETPSAGAGVGWQAFARAFPTNLHPGGAGTIQINLMNTGAKHSSGPITVTDMLPSGLSVTAAGAMGESGSGVEPEAQEVEQFGGKRWDCEWNETVRVTVTCTSNPAFLPTLPTGAGKKKYRLFERIAVEVAVAQGARQGTFEDQLTASGGSAVGAASGSDPVTISSEEPKFGFSGWDVWASNADGSPALQAGSHPYEITFALGFNETAAGKPAGGEVRDLEAVLPAGFFGEPNAVPRCTPALLDAEACPADTVVGVDLAQLAAEGGGGPGFGSLLPVYNMVPPKDVVAEFAAEIDGMPAYLDAVPSGFGEYRIVTHVDDVPAVGLSDNVVSLWGVPPEPSHDADRISFAKEAEGKECSETGCPSSAPPRPFLTLPTSCGGRQPEYAIRAVGTWEDPLATAEASAPVRDEMGEPAGFTGCSSLSFDPSLTIAPDTGFADTPAGLGVTLTFPQEALRTPERLVEATVKNSSVTLPEGLVINPGQAAGLQACSDEQAKLHEEGAPACPLASRVGTVKVKTPLLEGEPESELSGDVYVLEQSNGGPGEPANLLSERPALQLLLAISGDGANLKLVANVQPDPVTGRLTTTLTETPGLPFTSFELAFSGGAQAALATPVRCGTYSSNGDFTPWTSPFGADAVLASSFQVTAGPGGSGCAGGVLPFAPQLHAGSTTDVAGAHTSFSLLLQRGDGQQRIERLQFRAPPGLVGVISSVTPCPEPQAGKGECSQASEIGQATVASGPGPYPLVIPQPGEPASPIFLTGPTRLEGLNQSVAPFGLSILTHVIAGPFNLGDIVTRARIDVDPQTAQITVTTDPLPQIVHGVPTDLRLINSVIDRPGFMLNPTSCNESSFSGTAWGAPPPGVSEPSQAAAIGSRFQVGSCAQLSFAPKLQVGVTAHPSRVTGVAFTTKLSYPPNSLGSAANIARVKVELPKQLPSRLTTLQKACLASVFETNPASCPPASVVGRAKVRTPVLPVPLEGPAYFVSHGGAAFPDLTVILQGDNVTVQLVGTTYISKAGITSTTFQSTPDVPFETFELTLPQGHYSALTANTDLCQTNNLALQAEFTAQNGTLLKQATPVEPEGCPTTLQLLAHKTNVKKHTLTLTVYIPTAGKLTITGNGLTKTTRTTKHRETLTITLHTGHNSRTKLKLTLTPTHGKKQATTSPIRL